MRKYLPKIGGALLLTAIVFIASTHQAHAQLLGFLGLDLGIGEVLNLIMAWFFEQILSLMGWLLAIGGFILNVSMNLTLNIKGFVDNAPAVYNTWRIIRDISGIFIIFFLLYASIQLILGVQNPNFKDLIKNIVMAGILINFSFFITGLGIDASNIVSLQIYNAIAPANTLSTNNSTIGQNQIASESRWKDGGISNIFMNALKIPQLYKVPNQTTSALGSGTTNSGVINDSFKIVLISTVGIVIEFVAAISFAAAGLAFILRFVFLIFLLAFSPVYFISFIAPEVKSYSNKWWDMYKGMLIFMPVYLMLMYMALNVLTTTPMFGIKDTAVVSGTAVAAGASLIESAIAQTAGAGGAAGQEWWQQYISIAVNAVIVIFMLNLPLLAASSVASKVPYLGKFLDKTYDKFRAANVWKNIGTTAASQAGTRTLGRMAYAAGRSETVAKLASVTPLGGQIVSSGLSKVSKASFGGGKKGDYENRLKDKNKAREDMHKRIGDLDKSKYDTSTQEGRDELKAAQTYRSNLQKDYRKNLPWRSMSTGKPGGSLIGFMVDNRSNRQSSAKLTEEEDKKQLVRDEKKVRGDKRAAEEEIATIEAKIKNDSKPDGLTPGKPASQADIDRIAKLKADIVEYDKKIDTIDEAKEQNRLDKLAGGVAEKTKSEGGGGGEEKPKTT